MSAQIEKTVVSPYPFHTQQLLPDSGQHLFHRTLRCLVEVRHQRIRIRHRQCRPVHLAIGGERHRLQPHKGTRHHVRRQLRLQVFTQLRHLLLLSHTFVISSGFCSMVRCVGYRPCVFGSCRPVRHQPFVSRPIVLPGHYDSLSHLRQLTQSRPDLAQLDPEPPDLDLEVVPAQVLDMAIAAPPAQVSRPVHPRTRLLTERIVDEPLCRQLLTVQITTSYFISSYVNFTCYSNRAELTFCAKNINPCVGCWPTYRNAPRLLRQFALPESYTCFRWAVNIIQTSLGQKLSAATLKRR